MIFQYVIFYTITCLIIPLTLDSLVSLLFSSASLINNMLIHNVITKSLFMLLTLFFLAKSLEVELLVQSFNAHCQLAFYALQTVYTNSLSIQEHVSAIFPSPCQY